MFSRHTIVLEATDSAKSGRVYFCSNQIPNIIPSKIKKNIYIPVACLSTVTTTCTLPTCPSGQNDALDGKSTCTSAPSKCTGNNKHPRCYKSPSPFHTSTLPMHGHGAYARGQTMGSQYDRCEIFETQTPCDEPRCAPGLGVFYPLCQ